MHIGWFRNEREAREAVEGNAVDMNEAGCYDYAVIEKIGWGVYVGAARRWVYRFDPDSQKYEELELPECLQIKGAYDSLTYR